MNSLKLIQKSVNGDPDADLPSWTESMTSQLKLNKPHDINDHIYELRLFSFFILNLTCVQQYINVINAISLLFLGF